jgi:hypothetical protein
MVRCRVAPLLLLLGAVSGEILAGGPESWIPVRWEGGPLEVSRRAKALAADASVRTAVASWYAPATLALLDDTPVNCLLVTFGGGTNSELELEQRRQVKEYAGAAHKRGVAVLGIVYAGLDAAAIATASAEAGLDGLVLDGEFKAPFVAALEAAVHERQPGAVVIPIAKDAASVRTSARPVLAVEGVGPAARDLSDSGIRAGASAEPWIESNIWLVSSFRLGPRPRTVWISQQPNPSAPGDYLRCVADAAVAGGRWIVALDDALRAKLARKEPDALKRWRGIAAYLRFAEEHAAWRGFLPYGNMAVVVDAGSDDQALSDEYLNLVARRHVPYRLIERSHLAPAALAGFQAVLAVNLAPPTAAERKILQDFAEAGGLVVAGPSWGAPATEDNYAEVPLGKGRVAVYKNDPPDPEGVAKDMADLLQPEVMGLSVFNVPSILTYASTSNSDRRVLIQLLNYATRAYESRMTFRINGTFKTARMITPESAPAELAVEAIKNGRTEVVIPRLAVWGALVLE